MRKKNKREKKRGHPVRREDKGRRKRKRGE